MKRAGILMLLVGILCGGMAAGQTPGWQFRFIPGQVLTYKTQHVIHVNETANGGETMSSSNVIVIKRWEVVDVDAKGLATLHLKLTAMRNEQTRPNGEKALFDSEKPEQSTPELREQMSKYLNQVMAKIKVDSQGRVLEVMQGSANRFESEPPFVLLLPLKAPAEGQAWQRIYQIAVDPPLGTGEKYSASQTYQVNKIEAGQATIRVTTLIKEMPETVADQIPLLPNQVEGVATFDVTDGRLLAAQLGLERTLLNHQGEGSKYQYQSTFSMQLIGK